MIMKHMLFLLSYLAFLNFLFFFSVLRKAGLEPTTIASVVQYSIQLSYSRRPWKKRSPLAGFEPATFWLTAKRSHL